MMKSIQISDSERKVWLSTGNEGPLYENGALPLHSAVADAYSRGLSVPLTGEALKRVGSDLLPCFPVNRLRAERNHHGISGAKGNRSNPGSPPSERHRWPKLRESQFQSQTGPHKEPGHVSSFVRSLYRLTTTKRTGK